MRESDEDGESYVSPQLFHFDKSTWEDSYLEHPEHPDILAGMELREPELTKIMHEPKWSCSNPGCFGESLPDAPPGMALFSAKGPAGAGAPPRVVMVPLKYLAALEKTAQGGAARGQRLQLKTQREYDWMEKRQRLGNTASKLGDRAGKVLALGAALYAAHKGAAHFRGGGGKASVASLPHQNIHQKPQKKQP